MALIINDIEIQRLEGGLIAAWEDIPPSIISDELNRSGTMCGAIKPVLPGMSCCGQALTVRCMVGDNSALHYAITKAWPGAILVADVRGHMDTAVWGGIMTQAAKHAGVKGLVIDGAVRDIADLRKSEIGIFVRGAVPNGPHKGFGGEINGPIQCGGVSVDPGDLVIGDDDGIIVVKPTQLPGLMERCRARIAKEENMLREIEDGKTTVELTGLPPAEEIGKR